MKESNRNVDVLFANGDKSDKTNFALVERQILLFPVLVVLIVSVTFLFGGRCAAWHWWLSVLAVLTIPFTCSSCMSWDAVKSDCFFMMFLIIVWILSNVFIATGGHDQNIYHFPAIRMLSLGWNPVYSATPEALSSAPGERIVSGS